MGVSRESRAKQFLPFDALNGFQEALRKKEVEYVEKIELSEEMKEEISEVLCGLEKGDNVKIKYYKARQYHNAQGTIKEISKIKKRIVFTNEMIINFNDLLDIKKIY